MDGIQKEHNGKSDITYNCIKTMLKINTKGKELLGQVIRAAQASNIVRFPNTELKHFDKWEVNYLKAFLCVCEYIAGHTVVFFQNIKHQINSRTVC